MIYQLIWSGLGNHGNSHVFTFILNFNHHKIKVSWHNVCIMKSLKKEKKRREREREEIKDINPLFTIIFVFSDGIYN